MTKKTFKVKCEDTTYVFKLMKAKKALRIGFKINSLLLPVMASTIDGLKKDDILHGEKTTFKDASLILVEKLGELEVEDLIEDLFEECTVDDDEIDFDDHFQGNLEDMITCIQAVLKENFASLFTGKIKGMFGELTNLM